MKLLNQKVKDIYRDMVIARYEKMEVTPGHLRWNFRCQVNSVHDALTVGENMIAMCFCIDGDGDPVIHFINIHGTKYVDNTLGQWCAKHDYYFVRNIGKEEFFDVNRIFSAYRRQLRRTLPWWVRLLSDYEA
jgi:hypothetical protein